MIISSPLRLLNGLFFLGSRSYTLALGRLFRRKLENFVRLGELFFLIVTAAIESLLFHKVPLFAGIVLSLGKDTRKIKI